MDAFQHLLEQPESKIDPKLLEQYRSIKASLKELEELEAGTESKEEHKYITTFLKLIKQIGGEVMQAKYRYQSIDKNALLKNRLSQFATNINIFR